MSNTVKVSVSQVINASPAAAWGMMGEPSSLASWHPAIASSPVSTSGRERTCELADGGVVEEEIVDHRSEDREYTYRIVSSPLPLTDYVSTLRVTDADDGCACVTWESEFQPAGAPPEELEGMMRGLYEAGLGSLRERLEG